MIVALDYEKIKDGDYVFTGAFPFTILAAGIRLFSAGSKNMFNASIPIHECIAVWSKIGTVNTLQVAEMAPRRDGQPGDLKFHPMSKYLQKGIFSPYIISIKRSMFYDDKVKRTALINTLANLWTFGKTGYDYEGVAKFVMSFFKDSPSKYFCSQLRQVLDIHLGFNACPGHDDRVTPYQHFQSDLLHRVVGA